MAVQAHKWPVLISMCLVTVMLSIDASAVNIAIPVIAHDFYASLSNMQWVINSFFLLCAMVQIIGGHLGDAYGHKKVFVINVFLFVLASLGVGLSKNEMWMIAFRALQGATIGMAFPSSWILLYSVFPKNQIGFASSFFVATMGVFLAAGTPLGGLFVYTIGWQWIFYINVPLGLISLILAWKYCKPDVDLSKRHLDIRGAIFLMISLFGFAFAANQVQNWGFLSWPFFGFLLLGSSFLYFLYLTERKAEHRLVDFHFFKIKNYSIHCFLKVIVQLVFLSLLFSFPLYLQNVIGDSALLSGCILLFMTAIMAAFSPIHGKIVDVYGDKVTILISMILFLALSISMLFIGTFPHYLLLGWILWLAGFSIGLAYISSQTGIQSVVPETKKGAAMAIYLTIAWLACSLGVSASGTSIAIGSQHSLKSQDALKGDEWAQVERAAKGLFPSHSLPSPALQTIAQEAFVHGLHANAWVLILASGIGIVTALRLSKNKIKT